MISPSSLFKAFYVFQNLWWAEIQLFKPKEYLEKLVNVSVKLFLCLMADQRL